MSDPMHDLMHHHDDHDHDGPPAGHSEHSDPAAKSLADALAMCFRLLTVVMLLGVAMFLLTGVQRIQSGQMGIKFRFGRKLDVVGPGLAYTWPFPIGRIDVVNVTEQTLKVQDFWMAETPEDRTVELSKRPWGGKGLAPVWDGALLTGDSYLLHAELECSYVIQNPVSYEQNISDANEIVRSVVCAEAMRAAARRTADGLMTTDKVTFKTDIQRYAQKRLDLLDSGIAITQVRLGRVHLAAAPLGDYIKAQQAVQEAAQTEEQARKDAAEILRNAAGANYTMLVGEGGQDRGTFNRKPDEAANVVAASAPAEQAAAGSESPGGRGEGKQTQEASFDLIGQYAALRHQESRDEAALRAARDAGDAREAAALEVRCRNDKELAAAVLNRIDDVFVSDTIGGDASRIIASSIRYKTSVIEGVKGRLDQFEKMLPKYLQAPQYTLDSLWRQTRQEILSLPDIVKWYVTPAPGGGRTVVQINTPPEVVRKIQKQAIQQDANAK